MADSYPAFEMAAGSVKEVLTYSTAILVLTVTFAADKLVGTTNRIPRSLIWSWILYLVCIFAGVWTLHALTGELARGNPPDVYKDNVGIPAAVNLTAFLAGIVLTVVAGYHTLKLRLKASKK